MDIQCADFTKQSIQHFHEKDSSMKCSDMIDKDIQTIASRVSTVDVCLQAGSGATVMEDRGTQTSEEDFVDKEWASNITKTLTENILSNVNALQQFGNFSSYNSKIIPSAGAHFLNPPISALDQNQGSTEIVNVNFDYIAAEEEVTATPLGKCLKIESFQPSVSNICTAIRQPTLTYVEERQQTTSSKDSFTTQQSRSKRKRKPTSRYKESTISSTSLSQQNLTDIDMLDDKFKHQASSISSGTCDNSSSKQDGGLEEKPNIFHLQQVIHNVQPNISQTSTNPLISTTTYKSKYHRPSCQECAMTFESIRDLEEHKICHNQIPETEMSELSDTDDVPVEGLDHSQNSEISIVSKHVDRPSYYRYACKYCNNSYKTKKTLLKHVGECHFQEAAISDCSDATCDWCGEKVPPNIKMKNHKLLEDDSADVTILPCRVCKEHFIGKNSLHKHILESHTLDKKIGCYKCRFCHKTMQSFTNLVNHNEAKHVPKKTSKHCEVCGKSFKKPSQLSRHLKTHDESVTFKCEFCSELFKDKYYVKVHIRRKHTQEKPYICEVCGEAFCTSGNLKRHIHTHTGEKPYQCDVCGERFTAHWTCSVHKIRKHTGERNFQCDVCGRAFAYKSDLTKHIMTHNITKPFVCELCDKSFTGKSRLSVHMKKCHSGDEVQDDVGYLVNLI